MGFQRMGTEPGADAGGDQSGKEAGNHKTEREWTGDSTQNKGGLTNDKAGM